MEETHNLDINMYNLKEILGLFDLTYELSENDIKRAKKKVLMTHPDKSKLDPKYFLFYKKAFDIVFNFYKENNKYHSSQSNNNAYDANLHNTLDKNTTKKVSSTIKNMSTADFQKQFNKLFDENMINKVDTEKNAWFENEESIYKIEGVVNSKNMGEMLNKVKDTQNTLTKYRGVEELYVNSNSGNQLYEDEDENYVSTDPFSKFKFDDLRKVHKDQTVFMVSEKDINKVPQYSSVDHYMRSRGKQDTNPLDKQQAELILSEKNKIYRQQMMQKEYDSQLKTMNYAEKNKSVLSNFLRITN